MIDSPKTLAKAFKDAEWTAYDNLNKGDEVISVSHIETTNQYVVRTFTVDSVSPAMSTHQVIDTEGMAHNQYANSFYRIKPKLPTHEGAVIFNPQIKDIHKSLTSFVSATLISGVWRAVSNGGFLYNLAPEAITSFEKELK